MVADQGNQYLHSQKNDRFMKSIDTEKDICLLLLEKCVNKLKPNTAKLKKTMILWDTSPHEAAVSCPLYLS